MNLTPRQKRTKYFNEHIFKQRVSELILCSSIHNLKDYGAMYPFLTLKTIEDHIDTDWDWQALAVNGNLTLEFIIKHADKFNKTTGRPLLLYYMTPITNIDKSSILHIFPCLHGNGRLNEDIYSTIVFYNNSYHHYKSILASNNDIFKMVDKLLNFDHYYTFKTFINWVIKHVYREYMAAYKIQQWWFKILSNPHHKVGYRFIEKQYDLLFTNQTSDV
jgi:hypothetical protein